MLPYSVIGLFIGINEDTIKRLNWKVKVGILSFLILSMKICVEVEKQNIILIKFNYGYAGIGLLIKSVLIFLVCLFVSDIIISAKVEKIIIKLSQYTMGIYCIHILIGECLILILDVYSIVINGFYRAVIVCIISYIICWGLVKIPIKRIRNIIQ